MSMVTHSAFEGTARKPKRGLIPSMFLFTALALIVTELAGVISTIIDGMITSRTLGQDAYSAISLLGPFVSILLLIAGFISTGSQIVCSRHLGKGEKKEADAVFSLSLVITLLVSAVLVILCIFAPGFLISVSGVSKDLKPELQPLMDRYLYRYLFGIPALMLIQLLSPFIVMDGSGKLLSLSSIVLCVVNVAGDLISVRLLKAGIFGIGLSTSVALYAQLIVILTHFFRKTGTFRLSLRFSGLSHLKEIARAGSPSLVRKIASVLRDLLINRLNLVMALTTAAIAAKAMQNDLNLLMFCIATGVSRALLTMCTVYYSAEDLQGLKQLFSYAMKFGIITSGVAGAVLIVAAPWVAGFYSGDPEVISMSIFSIQWMAVSLAFDTASVSFQNYLQGIQHRKYVNILALIERFAIPVALAFLLGSLFGSKGILASGAIGKMLLVLIIFLIVCWKCRGIPKRWEDFMFLPEGFGGNESNNMYDRIDTIDEVAPLSEKAYLFCKDQGLEERTAKLISLFTEEIISGVILHGKKRRFGAYGVDYRLAINDDKISITFRDMCKAFDPLKWRELHSKDTSPDSIGIRMVLDMVKDARYFNAFRSNNLILSLNRKAVEDA